MHACAGSCTSDPTWSVCDFAAWPLATMSEGDQQTRTLPSKAFSSASLTEGLKLVDEQQVKEEFPDVADIEIKDRDTNKPQVM